MLKCDEVSREDQKFIENVERETSKKDDHYVFSPLLFRDSNFMLPNNKKQAIPRLMGLKKKDL